MANMDDILDELSGANEPEKCSVKIVTLGIPPKAIEINEGTTVGDLKAKLGQSGVKFVDEYGNTLRDSDTVDEDCTFYTATAKQNG